MLARSAPGDIDPPEIHAVLNRMLASEQFVRSQRMSRLLRFVVEKAVQGDTRQLSEYAIGIEVFDRNASTYNPGEDPIVRVQVGRLRDKLQQYYAKQTDEVGIRFEIPLGTYIPTIRRVATQACQASTGKIMVLPLTGIASGAASAQFALGLREEILHRLFTELGSVVVPLKRSLEGQDKQASTEVGYLLEGSVRHEEARVRVSLHLVDAKSGEVVWSEQFDGDVSCNIAGQEILAQKISAALKQWLGQISAN